MNDFHFSNPENGRRAHVRGNKASFGWLENRRPHTAVKPFKKEFPTQQEAAKYADAWKNGAPQADIALLRL
jgi:hypothetical protein